MIHAHNILLSLSTWSVAVINGAPRITATSGLALLALCVGLTLQSKADSSGTNSVKPSVDVASLENTEQGSIDPELELDDDLDTSTPFIRKQITIGSGDTLMRALTRAGAHRVEAHKAIEALSEHFDPRRLKPGHLLNLTFSETDGGSLSEDVASQGIQHLIMVEFRPNPLEELITVRNDIGDYVSSMSEVALSTEVVRKRGKIQSSLSSAAHRAELPLDITQKFINLYSYAVDFQRQIQPGDTFEVLYEVRHDDTNTAIGYGEIIYAELTLSGHKRVLYRFEHPKLSRGYGYYDANGHSAGRTLMRTPINGARLSSRFGNRKHPILGYMKQHKGVDFAAPIGTPIIAAGDGVIDRIGRHGAYGKYVRIRHNSTFSTAYAHLSRYAKGMTRGKAVAQGDVIGYVGNTGQSTGPHLHYEILVNGRQVNPQTVKLPTTDKLSGPMLSAMKKTVTQTNALIAATPLPKTVATR